MSKCRWETWSGTFGFVRCQLEDGHAETFHIFEAEAEDTPPKVGRWTISWTGGAQLGSCGEIKLDAWGTVACQLEDGHAGMHRAKNTSPAGEDYTFAWEQESEAWTSADINAEQARTAAATETYLTNRAELDRLLRYIESARYALEAALGPNGDPGYVAFALGELEAAVGGNAEEEGR